MIPRILFLDHATALGGAEHSLLLILKHLNREHWEPHLACANGALAERALKLGVTLHQVEMPRLRRSARFPFDWVLSIRDLAHITRRIDATMIHSNTIRSTLYAIPAAKLAHRPVVWHMRDFWLSEAKPDRLWLDRWGKRLLCDLSTQVVTNSHAVATHLPCCNHAIVVHNGIKVGCFEREMDKGSFRRQYGISTGTMVVGMVGRLRPWKGQEIFLRVAAQLHENRPDLRFLIVGGDPFQVQDDYSQRLQRITHELGLSDCVVFTGQLEDVRPALAAMDVFVHPGQPEPFGLVNIEAMAMAKPVVAFAHGALPEIVVNGETGLLVSPGDEQGMALALTKLLDEPDLALAMGKAGRSRVEQHFTIEQTVRGIEQVYELIVNG